MMQASLCAVSSQRKKTTLPTILCHRLQQHLWMMEPAITMVIGFLLARTTIVVYKIDDNNTHYNWLYPK